MELSVLIALSLSIQSVEPRRVDLDARFTPVTEGQSPGFAVGVVQDGVLIQEGYYGLANLEHASRVGPDTRFYIGSISKQFTAAIIIQLALEDRIDLDAPITAYVEDLPRTYADVTVRDLLHHTGGVREYTSLLLIRGDDRRLQDRMGQPDALALIAAQQGLDFEPGTQQRYSSSGYVLLAALIEAVEGQALAPVARRRLFDPLGMDQTLFDDDHGAIVRGRANGYQPDGEGWRVWLKHFDVVGDGGLLITLRDMARWDHELSTGTVFGNAWHTAMHTRGRLRNGTGLNSGPGLFFADHGGREVITHGGGLGGYIADQIRFPKDGLSIYVFANRNDDAAFQAWGLADLVLPPEPAANPTVFELSQTRFEGADNWVGAYFSDAINNRRFLRLNEEGGLDLHDGGDQFSAHLIPQGEGEFITHPGAHGLSLRQTSQGRQMSLDAGRYRYTATAFDNTAPSSLEALRPYTGWYCSAELEARLNYAIDGGAFIQRYAQGLPEQLYPIADNPNAGWNGARRVWTGVTMVRFDLEEGAAAHRVVIGDQRVSGVTFERCDPP